MIRVGRYQIGLRTLLLIAAVPALAWRPVAFVQEGFEQRQVNFEALANFHEEQATRWRGTIASGYEASHSVNMMMSNGVCVTPRISFDQRTADRWRKQCEAILEYHVALHNKYWWAARLPILPVGRDPNCPPAPQ